MGVVSNEREQESEDEGLEVVESHEALEEEGVVVTERDRGMSLKVSHTHYLVAMVTIVTCNSCF